MNFKDKLNWTKQYAKRHIFHMAVLAALVIFGTLHFSQFAMMGSIYGITQLNSSALTDYQEEMANARKASKQEILNIVDAKEKEFNTKLGHEAMELTSRIDILDSTIKPEEKRRMLIVKVRNAIVENTDTKLTIRELNNMAIAIIDYSYQYNLSVARVLAQIKQESNFVITAKSKAKAQGLMQVIPETWDYIVLKEFERNSADPDNIYHNIRAGCFYMSEQVHKFDTYDQALMAYNWGPDRVRKLIAGEYTTADIPRETKGYVSGINDLTKIFEKYGLE